MTATEIKIGKMVNDQGGVAGHKIDFTSFEAYGPPKTVEPVRRLKQCDGDFPRANIMKQPRHGSGLAA